MAFGDIVNQANSPGVQPYGIGGDANTIWHCDKGLPDKIHELKTSDLSSIRSVNSPATSPSGIGGALRAPRAPLPTAQRESGTERVRRHRPANPNPARPACGTRGESRD